MLVARVNSLLKGLYLKCHNQEDLVSLSGSLLSSLPYCHWPSQWQRKVFVPLAHLSSTKIGRCQFQTLCMGVESLEDTSKVEWRRQRAVGLEFSVSHFI